MQTQVSYFQIMRREWRRIILAGRKPNAPHHGNSNDPPTAGGAWLLTLGPPAPREYVRRSVYLLVPRGAKIFAVGCSFMQFCEKKAVRKLNATAHLCMATKISARFDSLHPLH